MISFALDEDEEMLRATVRKLAADVLRPRLRDAEKLRPPDVDPSVRAQLFALGVHGIDHRDADGGQGGRLTTALIATEELAWGDAGAALALAPSANYVAILAALGNDEQRARYLRPVLAGEKVGAFAYCEQPNSVVTASPHGSGTAWMLSGAKPFVLHGMRRDFVIVAADSGVFILAGGATRDVGPLLALDEARASEIVFDAQECERIGDLSSLTTPLLRASLHNAARQLGLARAAYEFALEYTQERRAFGKPVAHFQAIAFALAEMATEIDATRWLIWRAAAAEHFNHADGAAAIIAANDCAFRCADDAVQMLGGAGFIRDFPVEKWLRETKALALCGVPSEWCREVIAAAELGHELALPSMWLQPFFT